MASVSPPGPLAEKYATTGAGLNTFTSSADRMTAEGFLHSSERTSQVYKMNAILVTSMSSKHIFSMRLG